MARRGNTAANSVAEDRPVDREVFGRTSCSRPVARRLVVDPADGKIPPTTPEARSRAAARAEARKKRPRTRRCPEDRSLRPVHLARTTRLDDARRFTAACGEIVQGPNFVAIVYEMVHETRVISLDGQPHVGKSVRTHRRRTPDVGKAIRWSVETTNFKDQIAY